MHVILEHTPLSLIAAKPQQLHQLRRRCHLSVVLAMSKGDTTGFGPMQKYEGDDSDVDMPVRAKTGRAATPEASFSVKLILAFAGLAAIIAILITVIALAVGAASYQKAKIYATLPPSTSSSSSPSTNSYSSQRPPGDRFNCGYGDWVRIAYLNMSDPSHQCPRAWRGYMDPVRSCGRPVTSRSSCAAVYFSANGKQYSSVCGRALGYQKGSPDGFGSTDFDTTLDGIYVDGISMSHGSPRTHIWTFAAGLYTGENRNPNNCPCEGGRQQPGYVGGNFFCGSGDHTAPFEYNKFYDQDPLWNGANCPNTTGCPFNSPPWFSAKLPVPTYDDIEVRICGDQGTGNEDSPLQFLEIYIQ